jgi:DNA-binding IclR family transcriptional regulator
MCSVNLRNVRRLWYDPCMARPSPQTDRVVDVVELLTNRPDDGMTLSEIARRLGLSPVTVHPMLATLLRAGWLVRHPTRKTYRLGPALAMIGQTAAAGFSAIDVCHPVMAALQQDLRLTCLAVAPGEEQGLVVDIVRDPSDPQQGVRIGDPVPFQPPLGFSYMAWQDPKTVARWIARGGDDPDTEARYRRILAVTRERGFSVDIVVPPQAQLGRLLTQIDDGAFAGADNTSHSEVRDAIERYAATLEADAAYGPAELDPDQTYRLDTVSAPVFDHRAEVALIVGLRGFHESVTGRAAEKIGQRLVDACTELTSAIGGVRPAIDR